MKEASAIPSSVVGKFLEATALRKQAARLLERARRLDAAAVDQENRERAEVARGLHD